MPLINPSDYREVRAALSPDLEPADLPDEIIARDVYLGGAEREVLALDPQAATRTDIDQAHIRTAVILLTAARLALRLTRVSSERYSSFSATYLSIDPERQAAQLRAQAMTELRAISGVLEDLASARPVAMRIAYGGRGDLARWRGLGVGSAGWWR